MGQNKAAIHAARRAIGLRPSNVYPYLALAHAARNLGRSQEAEEYCCVAVKLAPQLAATRCTYAFILLDTGQLEKAKSEFEQALRLSPNSAENRIGLACVADAEGETREAEDRFQQIIKEFPTSTSAREAYGEFLCKRKRYQEADAQLSR